MKLTVVPEQCLVGSRGVENICLHCEKGTHQMNGHIKDFKNHFFQVLSLQLQIMKTSQYCSPFSDAQRFRFFNTWCQHPSQKHQVCTVFCQSCCCGNLNSGGTGLRVQKIKYSFLYRLRITVVWTTFQWLYQHLFQVEIRPSAIPAYPLAQAYSTTFLKSARFVKKCSVVSDL